MKCEQLCQGSGILPIVWMRKVWHREVEYCPGSQNRKVAADGIERPSSLSLDSQAATWYHLVGSSTRPSPGRVYPRAFASLGNRKYLLESEKGWSVSKGTLG